MKRSRGSQLIRQWKLLQACSNDEGQTIEELRELFGASRRTIYRDIAILKRAGAKIHSRKDAQEIRYRTHHPFFETPSPSS